MPALPGLWGTVLYAGFARSLEDRFTQTYKGSDSVGPCRRCLLRLTRQLDYCRMFSGSRYNKQKTNKEEERLR